MLVKNIMDTVVLHEIISRINTLQPNTNRLWGKMNVAQMMVHCTGPLIMMLGTKNYKQGLIGKLFGKSIRNKFLSGKPIKKNLPTDKELKILSNVDFEPSKNNLIHTLNQFVNSDNVGNITHPFFGKMTRDEWGGFMYSHINHHLTQFGA